MEARTGLFHHTESNQWLEESDGEEGTCRFVHQPVDSSGFRSTHNLLYDGRRVDKDVPAKKWL